MWVFSKNKAITSQHRKSLCNRLRNTVLSDRTWLPFPRKQIKTVMKIIGEIDAEVLYYMILPHDLLKVMRLHV